MLETMSRKVEELTGNEILGKLKGNFLLMCPITYIKTVCYQQIFS